MVEESMTTTFPAGAPPIVSTAPDWKPVPATVTAVPPAACPELGETPRTWSVGRTSVTVRHSENSEVIGPFEAVAVTMDPGSSERGSTTEMAASPMEFVYAVVEPITLVPSP